MLRRHLPSTAHGEGGGGGGGGGGDQPRPYAGPRGVEAHCRQGRDASMGQPRRGAPPARHGGPPAAADAQARAVVCVDGGGA